MPVLIVGASVAGIRTAQALRRGGYDGRITVVGEETHHPYDRPPLSKEMLGRLVKEHGYPSVCRRSVIDSEPFKEALTLNGQDVALTV